MKNFWRAKADGSSAGKFQRSARKIDRKHFGGRKPPVPATGNFLSDRSMRENGQEILPSSIIIENNCDIMNIDPPKISRNPKKKDKIKCNWCDKEMLGNNFGTHKCIPTATYKSYTLVVPKGQVSIANMFPKAQKE